MEDTRYVVTNGSTFVDLKLDVTNHAISIPLDAI
jgi:hypothetical protein